MKKVIMVKCISCGEKKDASDSQELPLCEKCGSPMLLDRVAEQRSGGKRTANKQSIKRPLNKGYYNY